jgi:hypothetical protein
LKSALDRAGRAVDCRHGAVDSLLSGVK